MQHHWHRHTYRDIELAKFEAFLNREQCKEIKALVRGRQQLAYPIKGWVQQKHSVNCSGSTIQQHVSTFSSCKASLCCITQACIRQETALALSSVTTAASHFLHCWNRSVTEDWTCRFWEGIYVLYTYAAKRTTSQKVQKHLSTPVVGGEVNILRHMTFCTWGGAAFTT